jgi:hypothetical protein
MGCGDSVEMGQMMSVDQQFAALNLMHLLNGANFENELEKNIFMAINIARVAPA